MFPPTSLTPLLRYDVDRRRLWIAGQRVHHGMTGVLLLATGAALMLHDWKDRSLWFQLGPDTQS
jgi:hypothetical protein